MSGRILVIGYINAPVTSRCPSVKALLVIEDRLAPASSRVLAPFAGDSPGLSAILCAYLCQVNTTENEDDLV